MSLVDRCTTHKHRCFMSTWFLVTIQKLLNDNISIPMCFISYQRMYIFLLLLMTNNISKPLFVLKTTNAVWLFYTKNVVVKKTTGWNLYTSNTSNWSTIYSLFVTRKIVWRIHKNEDCVKLLHDSHNWQMNNDLYAEK